MAFGKKNMKFGKKGLIAEIAILLGVASITTVGLAAYVVTGGTKETIVNTEKPTEVEITNNIVSIGATIDAETGTLLFEPTAPVSTGRLQSTGTGDMEVDITITITADSQSALKGNKIAVTVEPVFVNSSTGDTTIGDYVVVPTVQPIDISSLTPTKDLPATQSLKLTWTWGSKFGNSDPCTWANGKNTNELNDNNMKKTIEDFQTAVANVASYKITLDLTEGK